MSHPTDRPASGAARTRRKPAPVAPARFDYWLWLDRVLHYHWRGGDDPKRHPSSWPICCRVRVFYDSPDRPLLVVAEHVAKGCGNLEILASNAREALCYQSSLGAFEGVRIAPETLLWVNRIDGPNGSYSRRAERFSFVDCDVEYKLGQDLPAVPTSRRALVERFGIELVEDVKRLVYHAAPFHP
jgi:hypothetical protein